MTAEVQEDRSPKYGSSAFECPYCGVFAAQLWAEDSVGDWQVTENGRYWKGWKRSECHHCHIVAVWSHERKLVWSQKASFGPKPNPDMPPDVLALYEEARSVLRISPRSAAGLLRLALQTLIDGLEPDGKTINDKIRRLVTRGLEPTARKAMDVLRVVGNNAVHPGEILIDGDEELVPALFAMLNLIVHHVLSRPQQVDSLFESLPENARNAIHRRDNVKLVPLTKPSKTSSDKSDDVKKTAS